MRNIIKNIKLWIKLYSGKTIKFKKLPQCNYCKYLSECHGIYFVKLPKNYKCESFEEKTCEICGHAESVHRIIVDNIGKHLMCDKCNSLCF